MLERQPRSLVAVDELMRIADAAGKLSDPGIQGMIEAYAVRGDAKIAQRLVRMCQGPAVQHLLSGVPFRQPQQEEFMERTPGGPRIHLGHAHLTNARISYPAAYLGENMLVLGEPGTGKTNLLLSTAAQALFKGIHVWIIEMEKRDGRKLIPGFEQLIGFIDLRTFKCNPLEVHEGHDPREKMAEFVKIFSRIYQVYELGEQLLFMAIHFLHEQRGVYRGEKNFPTLRDLRDTLVCLNTFHGNKVSPASNIGKARDSLIAKLDGLLAVVHGTFDCSRGYPISLLAQSSFVLEVKALGERHAQFLADILLTDLIRERVRTNQMGLGLRNLLVIDEAKALVPRQPHGDTRLSPLTYILAQGREAGLGCLLADQTTMLDEAVFKLASMKVCFRLADGDCLRRMQRSLSMDDRQVAINPELKVGEAIFGIKGFSPFMVTTSKFPPDGDTP